MKPNFTETGTNFAKFILMKFCCLRKSFFAKSVVSENFGRFNFAKTNYQVPLKPGFLCLTKIANFFFSAKK